MCSLRARVAGTGRLLPSFKRYSPRLVIGSDAKLIGSEVDSTIKGRCCARLRPTKSSAHRFFAESILDLIGYAVEIVVLDLLVSKKR